MIVASFFFRTLGGRLYNLKPGKVSVVSVIVVSTNRLSITFSLYNIRVYYCAAFKDNIFNQKTDEVLIDFTVILTV